MILTDNDIRARISSGHISITPFNSEQLGSNSYDLCLSAHLLEYTDEILDVAKMNNYRRYTIPIEGIVLQPGKLYLGSTVEHTRSFDVVPLLEGKSSLGRLGLTIHVTAGFGDAGFEGHWTLEMTVAHPLRIYAGMPIGQIYYILPLGSFSKPYNTKSDAKYRNQGYMPEPSQMWRHFAKSLSSTL